MEFLKFKHSANSGDLIAAMAGIHEVCAKRNKKAIIYQRLNMPGSYYEGATHPIKDSNNIDVTMNLKMFEYLKPLIEGQDYVHEFLIYNGEQVDFDLDNIRNFKINIPLGQIQRWYFYVYPQMACDLSEGWINVPENKITPLSQYIIINRTEMYNNFNITYFFLKYYQERLIFAGTQDEHKKFCLDWGINIPLLVVNNFNELASAINDCMFFLGNQSFCWNLAEAMKIPRILEVCEFAPNCIPVGYDGYDFYHQHSLEYYFKKLLNNHSYDNKNCIICGNLSVKLFQKNNIDYHICTECHTLFSEKLDNSHKVGGSNEDIRNETNIPIILERLKSFEFTNLNILDFGCGNGILLNAMKKEGIKCFGYDKYNEKYNKLPKKNTYNIVTLIEVIEHLTSPFDELDLIYNSLKENGLLYIETSFVDIALKMGIKLSEFEYVNPQLGHNTIFSHYSLDILMFQKGFKKIQQINDNVIIYQKK